MSDGPKGGAPRRNTNDAAGSVRVSITLMRDGKAVPGNITRSYTRQNSTVSAVYEQLLVGYQPPR